MDNNTHIFSVPGAASEGHQAVLTASLSAAHKRVSLWLSGPLVAWEGVWFSLLLLFFSLSLSLVPSQLLVLSLPFWAPVSFITLLWRKQGFPKNHMGKSGGPMV